MQVYRDLRILTARPTPEDEARRPASALRSRRCRRELFDRPLVPGSRRGDRGGRAGRAAADPGRGHRALFQDADPRARGRAADPAGGPLGGARPARAGRGGAALRRADPARPGNRAPADAGRPRPHHPGAGGGRGDRPLAHRLASRRDDAGARPGSCREGVSRARPRRTLPPDRCAVRADARRRCARGGRGARRPFALALAARHEGAGRAVADPASPRRDSRWRRRPRPASATAAATASGRRPGSAINCRIGPGWRPTSPKRRSCAPWRADARASTATSRARRSAVRRPAPTRQA